MNVRFDFTVIWHGSICVYYLLLAGIRSAVVLGQTNHVRSQTSSVMCQRKIYFRTHIVLLIMNLSLIAPIASMIRGERSYTLGLIPAIAMAAYTIYRITASVLHYRKAKRQSNLLLSELRTINLMDAMVAVLSLQNALIMSKGGPSEGMVTLTAWTSGGILLLIVVIMVRSFMKIRE